MRRGAAAGPALRRGAASGPAWSRGAAAGPAWRRGATSSLDVAGLSGPACESCDESQACSASDPRLTCDLRRLPARPVLPVVPCPPAGGRLAAALCLVTRPSAASGEEGCEATRRSRGSPSRRRRACHDMASAARRRLEGERATGTRGRHGGPPPLDGVHVRRAGKEAGKGLQSSRARGCQARVLLSEELLGQVPRVGEQRVYCYGGLRQDLRGLRAALACVRNFAEDESSQALWRLA